MTTTHDFTTPHSIGSDPRRAAQLQIASTIDLDTIRVDLLGGPIGGHGFRSGTWSATVAGVPVRFFSSVPHCCDLAEQRDRLRRAAALHIAGVRSGYIASPAD